MKEGLTMRNKRFATLDTDDLFPILKLNLVNGGKMNIPADLLGKWSVVLFYRGGWCGFCRQQLMNYEVNTYLFKKLDIQIIAVSSDPQDEAVKTVEHLGLTYPVGYGFDPQYISSQTGAYLSDDSTYVHATGFLLGPDGKVVNAVYSFRSVGRLMPQDVTALVSIIRSRK